MRVLIAEDDSVSRRKLRFLLERMGHEVVEATTGNEAWEVMRRDDAPQFAILDVVMPGVDGTEVCRRIRGLAAAVQPYLILLTVQGRKSDVVAGLDAGANDYLAKPFDVEELRARVSVGVRVLDLQLRLATRIQKLEEALARVSQLQSLLRNDRNVYEFGPFRLEAAERRLLRAGEPVPLTAKVFDLLLLLVQNAGHLLEKDEIMRELWPGQIVEENNLTVSMSLLRKALGPGPGRGEYIETVPKRGYRFATEVRRTP